VLLALEYWPAMQTLQSVGRLWLVEKLPAAQRVQVPYAAPANVRQKLPGAQREQMLVLPNSSLTMPHRPAQPEQVQNTDVDKLWV
jgi:hypothetical protein